MMGAEMTGLLQELAGRFAYRFGGFAVNMDGYYLAGVGFLDIANDGTLKGNHRFSLLRLRGQDELKTGEYSLAGTLSMNSDGTGSAKVRFTTNSSGFDNSDSSFHVILGSDINHLWFITAGGKRVGSGNPTCELTQLEAVRMNPLPS
jgi:hypothetical protein